MRKRKIDFIYISSALNTIDAGACDALHLGSDHRLVLSEIEFVQKAKRKRGPRRKSMKGWKPYISRDGEAIDYWNALDNYLQCDQPRNLHEVESSILKTAQDSDIRTYSSGIKWQNDEISNLLHQRKYEKNKEVRRELSKIIKKKTRKALRSWKDKHINMVLDEFKNLDRLQQIEMQKKFERDYEHSNSNDFVSMLREMYQD